MRAISRYFRRQRPIRPQEMQLDRVGPQMILGLGTAGFASIATEVVPNPTSPLAVANNRQPVSLPFFDPVQTQALANLKRISFKIAPCVLSHVGIS